MGAAGEKKDVDAIWAQLNAKNAGKGTSASFGRVWTSIKTGNDPVKAPSQKKAESGKKENETGGKNTAPVAQRPQERTAAEQGVMVASSGGIDLSGVSSEEELAALLQRDLFGLKDTVIATRKTALSRLLGCAQVSDCCAAGYVAEAEELAFQPGQFFNL